MATSNINSQNSMASTTDDGTDEEEEEEASAMSLIDHLEELRWRILKTLIAIVVGGIIAFFFRDQIIQFLVLPLPDQASAALGIHNGHKLITTGLAEGFTVYLKLSLAAGILLAIPVLLYQTWAFVSPGLYAREKKYAVPFIFVGIVLFLAGISLGYIVLRFPVQWLINIASDNFIELISADSYFTFVAFFMLAFGIVFEIPLVLTFLAQIGVITSDTLKKRRAASHVGLWIAATFLTPGADIYSPIILGVAMSFLFELTIIFIRITKK
jgi:sec-independent protein translocase protein TatC